MSGPFLQQIICNGTTVRPITPLNEASTIFHTADCRHRSHLKPRSRRAFPSFQAPRVQMCLNNLYPKKTVGRYPHG